MNIHYIWTKATRWLLISFDNVRGRSVFSGKQGISEDKEGHQPAVMDLNSTVNESGFRERDQSTRVLTGCFLSLLILSTLLGNMLVCAAVTKFRHLRSKVTNFFVISLAVSDLLVAILVMPWKAVTEITGFWPFGSFCNVWVAFDIMCSTASILNLCVISVDRYWAISSPFRYERKMTPRVAFVMISAAWTLSVLISFIPVHLKWHKAPPTNLLLPNTSRRAHRTDNCDSSLNRTYAISSSLVSFYIPVAIMIMTYTQIYRIAQKQIRRITALERAAESAKIRHEGTASAPSADPESSFKLSFKRETKVLKTLSVIMGVFVCCWLPFFVLNCVVPFCERDHAAGADVHATCVSPTTFDVFVWFGWANSSLNPIIYAFNTDFRRAFAVLLGCQRVCPGKNMMETPCLKQQLKKHYTALLSSSVGPDGPLARKQTCSKMQPVSQHLVQEKASGQEGEGIWD